MHYILHPKSDNYWQQQCLDNVAEYLGYHYKCEIFNSIQKDKGTPIVVGAHYWDYLPKDAIIFNTEQLNKSVMVSDWYEDKLRTVGKVIDYDQRNRILTAEEECSRLLANTRFEESCKIAESTDKWDKIDISPNPLWLKKFNVDALPKNIEVLHYGSLNFRRQYVIEHLARSGINVTVANQLFGYQLDDYIARAKYVLHIHFYDKGYYAPFRCTYAMHGAEVLAERDEATPDYITQWDYDNLDGLVEMIKGGIINSERNKIVEGLKNDIR